MGLFLLPFERVERNPHKILGFCCLCFVRILYISSKLLKGFPRPSNYPTTVSMCLRWPRHTSPLPCSLQSIRVVTLTPSQVRDTLIMQFTRLFYSVPQRGQSFGVWEMTCKDNQRGPSIHRVWLRVVSHARSETDPRRLRKSFSGAREVQVRFLECLRACECDFLSLSVPVSFKVGLKETKWNQTERNKNKNRFGRAEATDHHGDQRGSGLCLFPCQVLLGDSSPSCRCQVCELQ